MMVGSLDYGASYCHWAYISKIAVNEKRYHLGKGHKEELLLVGKLKVPRAKANILLMQIQGLLGWRVPGKLDGTIATFSP